MEEEWKEIPGYSGFEASTESRIRSPKGEIVSQFLSGLPQYYYVNIFTDDGVRAQRRAHVLVALAFIPNPENLPIVDHIDRDKLNNRISNLRWVTRSDNMRNKEDSVWVYEGFHILDHVEKYENARAAYQYIINYYRSGMPIEEAIAEYELYLDVGLRKRVVEYKGEDVNLSKLCASLGKDYNSVTQRLSLGWNIWNALNGVKESYPNSIEVPSDSVSGVWFPSLKYLQGYLGNFGDNLRSKILKVDSYQELLSYDRFDHLRQTVKGVTGTIEELCKHFGVTEALVNTRTGSRYNMTLEQALTEPVKRVKLITINGESKSPKVWYEFFGLNAKSANSCKARNKFTFKETLEYYGVDTSEMVFS